MQLPVPTNWNGHFFVPAFEATIYSSKFKEVFYLKWFRKMGTTILINWTLYFNSSTWLQDCWYFCLLFYLLECRTLHVGNILPTNTRTWMSFSRTLSMHKILYFIWLNFSYFSCPSRKKCLISMLFNKQ